MEIKEQIKDYFKSGITRKTIEELSNDITDIFTLWLDSNGYLPIQAGEDGLLKPECICEIICQGILCKSRKHGGFCYEANLIYKCLKAQKALDDKEKAEAVKKVFDWINKELDTRIGNGNYEVSLDEIRLRCSSADLEFVWNEIKSDIKAFKKKTLEELEEKK